MRDRFANLARWAALLVCLFAACAFYVMGVIPT